MPRRQRTQSDAAGQDSFLDIVANLVGILIILVMIVGVRAKDALVQTTPPAAEPVEVISEAEIASSKAAADNIERSVVQLQAQVERQDLEVRYRRKERDKILAQLTQARQQLAAARQQLDGEQQQQFDRQAKIVEAQSELEDLTRRLRQVSTEAIPVNVIRHMPTPLAKTVFGEEVHFRLQAGRLAYIPWDELVDQLKEEAKQKVWKLKNAPAITETLGPLHGFRMQYRLIRVDHPVQTRAGPAVQAAVELDQFTMVPVRQDLGETIDQALREGSELLFMLAKRKPAQTTVTIWVYPESFGEFRRVRDFLYQRGFLTASRPLPQNHPIGGSPRGSRSVSQ